MQHGAAKRRGVLSGGRVQGGHNLVDRRLLGLAHVLAVLAVRSCDFVGQVDDELAVLRHLNWRGLALEQLDRVAHVLQCVLLELVRGVVVSVIAFRFRRYDLIQKLALTVLLARLRVGLGPMPFSYVARWRRWISAGRSWLMLRS